MTATLLDGGGSPISGQTLALTTDPSGATVELNTSGGLVTDANGKVTATVKSTSAQTVKVTAGATVSGNTVNATAVDLVFNAATFTLAYSPAGPYVAGDTITVTATLLDGGGNPMTGQTLALTTNPSDGTVILDTSGGLATDASGKVSATIKSTSAQNVTVSASVTVNGTTVSAVAPGDLVFNTFVPPTLTLAAASAGPYTAGGTVTVTATLLDGSGNPITGQTLALTTNPSDGTVELTTGGGLVTNAGGQVTATVKSTSAQAVTVSASATVNSTPVTATPVNLVFNSATFTLVYSPAGPYTAGDTINVTATLLDGGGNPITGQTLTLSTSPSAPTVELDTTGGLVTDANGQVTATVKSTTNQSVTISGSATVNGITVAGVASGGDMVFNPATLNLVYSSAGPYTVGEEVTVTATLLDGGGNPITGQTLTLSTSPSAPSVELTTGGGLVTDASGQVTATVKSNSAQNVTISSSATVNGNTVTGVAPGGDLVFNVATLDLVYSPAGPYTAGDEVTVTATLLDGGGNPMTGQTLTLSTTPSAPTVELDTTGGLVTNASGQVTATIKSTSAQNVTVSAGATVNGNTVTGVAPGGDLVFNTPSPPTVTVSGGSSGPYAKNTNVTLTATVVNSSGQPVVGETVTWTATPPDATVTVTPGGVTDATGKATATVTSSKGQSVAVTASATVNTMTGTSAPRNMVFGIYAVTFKSGLTDLVTSATGGSRTTTLTVSVTEDGTAAPDNMTVNWSTTADGWTNDGTGPGVTANWGTQVTELGTLSAATSQTNGGEASVTFTSNSPFGTVGVATVTAAMAADTSKTAAKDVVVGLGGIHSDVEWSTAATLCGGSSPATSVIQANVGRSNGNYFKDTKLPTTKQLRTVAGKATTGFNSGNQYWSGLAYKLSSSSPYFNATTYEWGSVEESNPNITNTSDAVCLK